MGGPIADNVCDYDYNNPGRNHYFRGEERNPELSEFKNFLIIESENNHKFYRWK